MSFELTAEAIHLDIPQRQKMVLIVLADCADKHGCNAYPSLKTIAARSSCSRKTAQRALKELRLAGLIEVERKSTQHFPTVWKVDLSRGVKLTRLNYSGESLSPPGRSNSATRDSNFDTQINESIKEPSMEKKFLSLVDGDEKLLRTVIDYALFTRLAESEALINDDVFRRGLQAVVMWQAHALHRGLKPNNGETDAEFYFRLACEKPGE